MSERPEIIAHRGAPRDLPENSVPSFERALALGAEAIELDAHATRDGVVVVHHDPVPRARPDSPNLVGRAIASLTLDELRSFRLDGGVPIPTLDEVLRAVAGAARVYVEIKGRGIERAVVEAVAPYAARCAIHSFDHRAAALVRQLDPVLPCGVLLSSYLVDTATAMRRAGARDLWQQWDLIDSALVRAVHEHGGRVIAWTVNDMAVARDLAALGVDGICSDLPGELRATLRA